MAKAFPSDTIALKISTGGNSAGNGGDGVNAGDITSKPSIECLGIVGQIASGESPGLAEQRAKAVRDLLGAHGVPLDRLLTIGATAKVFGNGSRPAEPDPADRRVGFSVLLERPASR